MKITKWGEYGILAALELAENGSILTASELCISLNIDLDYLRQIMHRLKCGDIVNTVRGPKGGYVLCRHPQNITLLDILIAAEGKTFEIICDSNPIFPDICSSSALGKEHSCALAFVWRDLKAKIDDHLNNITLESLTKKDIVYQIRNVAVRK
jgi:Rrf2 family protein